MTDTSFFSALNTVEVVVADCIVSMRFCSSRFQSFHYFSLNFCSTHVHFPTFNSLLFLSCILFRNTPQSLQKYNFKNWVQIGENLWKKKQRKIQIIEYACSQLSRKANTNDFGEGTVSVHDSSTFQGVQKCNSSYFIVF